MFGKRKKEASKQDVLLNELAEKLDGFIGGLVGNASESTQRDIRSRIASAVSGGYDFADTLHNIYLDYGYPQTLNFSNFWNMYRRFGLAKNGVDLPVDTTWMTEPTIESPDKQFMKELDVLIRKKMFWIRAKGLDNRQRVGRYAGMFMRVRDGKKPDVPIDSKLPGLGALIQMTPLYEGQLQVLETETDPMSDNFGLPKMYQFNGGAAGNRNEDNQNAFSIHPSRVVIAAEGADNGGIYGIPALEAGYNSLMDLRKIIGGAGEGFYKNSSQSIIFELKDAATAKANAPLLEKFNEQYDDFARNRMRRSMWTPGLEAKTLESNMISPKDSFDVALNDFAASVKIPSTLLIGKQTGRLASEEDSRGFLAGINSRRENYGTEMVSSLIDWCIEFGILPTAKYEVEWDDLLASSDEERLTNADKMADINQKMFLSGSSAPFDSDEIREAAGFEAEDEVDEGGEDIDEDLIDGEE